MRPARLQETNSPKFITTLPSARCNGSPFQYLRSTAVAPGHHPDGDLSGHLGTRIKLGNLKPRRDFLYVKDTVRGFIETEKCDGAIGRVVNIGSGEDISIGEFTTRLSISRVKRAVDRGPNGLHETSEVMRLLSDTGLAATSSDGLHTLLSGFKRDDRVVSGEPFPVQGRELSVVKVSVLVMSVGKQDLQEAQHGMKMRSR